MGAGPLPTPPTARALRRALERFIRCTAAYFPLGWGETALQRPLQVPWGRTSCLVPCSPVLLPHCGCWPASKPPADRALLRVLSDALQRVLCQAEGRPPFHVLYKSPGALFRASFLIPQRYFLAVGAGPLTPLRPQRTRAIYPVYCSMFSVRPKPRRGSSSMSSTSPPGLYSIPRSLVCCALSARGCFVRCTVAYFLPGRGETALQRPLQVPWRPTPCLVPHSPMLLPRYGCRPRTVTAGGPRSQRTRALYPMHCSMFSAKSGRVHPSMCSSGK
ncbi:hypothetical protein NDU88_001924 [Pleurodeles waltl]|uniref:Uncharacterized protein n=1 Tax=Pleurodeles waltl TaxID=8319 RepID=A0AAV7KTX6_PLEWA|nr:hypothetical protein NDU88_001924 [Pleurodeles waltl]